MPNGYTENASRCDDTILLNTSKKTVIWVLFIHQKHSYASLPFFVFLQYLFNSVVVLSGISEWNTYPIWTRMFQTSGTYVWYRYIRKCLEFFFSLYYQRCSDCCWKRDRNHVIRETNANKLKQKGAFHYWTLRKISANFLK